MTPDLYIHGESGVHKKLYFEDGKLVVKREQDLGNMLEHFRHQSENINRKAFGQVAARVPTLLYWRWREEWEKKHADKWEWKTYFAMKLNSGDYAKLRNQKL